MKTNKNLESLRSDLYAPGATQTIKVNGGHICESTFWVSKEVTVLGTKYKVKQEVNGTFISGTKADPVNV